MADLSTKQARAVGKAIEMVLRAQYQGAEQIAKAKADQDALIKQQEEAKRAQAALNREVEHARKIYESTRTPLERYIADTERLAKHWVSGRIDAETYRRELERLQTTLGKLQKVASPFDSSRLAAANVASPFVMNMGALGRSALPMPVYNASAGGMNMGALSHMPDGRWGAGMANLSAQNADAEAIRQQQRAYLARVRYNSNVMEQGRRAAARARFFGGSGDFIRGAMPFVGAIGAGAIVGGSWNAFLDDEMSDARLRGALRATGRTDINFAGLDAFANERQARTMFSGGETLGAAARLSTFTNIRGDQFTGVLKAAQDLATVFGTDLESAAMTLGKAMEYPEEGIKALAKAGIILSDDAKKAIVALAESGDAEAARAKMLEEINRRVGGAAEEAGAGPNGVWAQLKNELSDIGTVIGSHALPAIRWLKESLANLTPPTPGGHSAAVSGTASRARSLADAAVSPEATYQEMNNFMMGDMRTQERRLLDRQAEVQKELAGVKVNPIRLNNLSAELQEINAALDQLTQAGNLLERAMREEKKTGARGKRRAASQEYDAEWNRMLEQAEWEAFLGMPVNMDTFAEEWNEGAGTQDRIAEWGKQARKEIEDQQRERDRILRSTMTPAQKRDARLAEIEKVKSEMTAEQYEYAKAQAEEDYRKATEGKEVKTKSKRGGRGDTPELQAFESRLMAGHTFAPEVEVQIDLARETNKHLEDIKKANQDTNKALDRIAMSMQKRVGPTLEAANFN